ncbi:hypothetical protein [Antrihabitans cavernicola]|uniref:Uncharacterized protein n=1 Tax=Antrihabitans cavernicola TaxID=2495913 RepID=A0A5A7S0I9_9NOCA|nr:hypothetical protein [Spelaeibacter cavernicola]KAA0015978.1 hypothetical protein FOY51_26870 [Spelaeibacter cavernicola]
MVNDEEDSPLSRNRLKSRRPSDQERERIRDDLIARVRVVQQEGWADHHCTWSNRDVMAVAYLLGDTHVLRLSGVTGAAVLEYYACDLYGVNGGQQDIDDGLPLTRKWFLNTHTALIESKHT